MTTETTQNSNDARPARDEEITIIELFNLMRKHVWQVLFITLIIGAFTALYLSKVSPSYRATAQIQIGGQQNNMMSLVDMLPMSSSSKEQIETQYQLIRSRQFAERVIDDLRLEQKDEFALSQPSPIKKIIAMVTGQEPERSKIDRRQIIAMFQARLTVSPVSNTELVNISFESHSPQLAKIVANKVGDTYIEYLAELRHASSESTNQWLMSRMVALGEKLEVSEMNLQTFREEHDIVDLRGVVGLVSKQLTELTEQYMESERKRSETEVVAAIIKDANSDPKVLIEMPEIYNHRTIQEARTIQSKLEREASELSGRYGPKHPKRIALEARLASVKSETIAKIGELVSGIQQNYRAQKAKEVAIESRLDTAKDDYQRLSRLNTEFEQLLREVKTNEQLYQTFLTRLRENDAISDLEQSMNVRFIDRAQSPQAPFKPRKTLSLLVVMIATVITLFAFFLLRNMLKDTMNTRNQLDRLVKEPVLAVLPSLKGRYRTASLIQHKKESHFIEAMHSLRTALMFKHNEHPPKVIAITSSVPNEGKSTVAINLARSFSDMEKVLLIDADLRHPSIGRAFGLDKNRPGLSNLLAKTHQITDCVVRYEDPALDILPSGICPSNPLAFLSMKRFQVLLRVLGNFYDRIIIEVPPVHSVSDAIVVSRMVDSVLYVVNGENTKREQIIAGIERLHQVRAPLEGIVLNQSDEKRGRGYYSAYYGQVKSNIIPLPLRAKANKRS